MRIILINVSHIIIKVIQNLNGAILMIILNNKIMMNVSLLYKALLKMLIISGITNND